MGYDTTSGEEIAIKLEFKSSKHLENEYTIYKAIGNHISVPHVKWFGEEHGQRALVLSLLGPSLEDLVVASGSSFELKTILVIADQLVRFIFILFILIVLIFLWYKH